MSEEELGSNGVIILDEEYSVRKDFRSWTLIYQKRVPSKKDPSSMTEHYEPLYYPDLTTALQAYVDKREKVSSSIEEALTEMRSAMARIEEIFKDVPHVLSMVETGKEVR